MTASSSPVGHRSREVPRLHVVTDDGILAGPSFLETAKALLDSGGAGVALHLRGPRTSGRLLHRLARELSPVARERGAWLAVNDRVDVALTVDGLAAHLGGRSLGSAAARRLVGPDVALGRSVHDMEEARREASSGVDYLFFGTVWPTPSHPGREGAGVDALASAVDAVQPLPVLAIGGVTVPRAAEARARGAHGVAVIRGVWDAHSPAAAVTEYISALGGPCERGRRSSRRGPTGIEE